MGGSSSKQDIVAKLEELDKKELDLNLKLKGMQEELNGMVPKNEQIKTNSDLTPNSRINHDYFSTEKVKPGVPLKTGKKILYFNVLWFCSYHFFCSSGMLLRRSISDNYKLCE